MHLWDTDCCRLGEYSGGNLIYTFCPLTIFPRYLLWLLFQSRYCTKWTFGLTPQKLFFSFYRFLVKQNKILLTQHSNTHPCNFSCWETLKNCSTNPKTVKIILQSTVPWQAQGKRQEYRMSSLLQAVAGRRCALPAGQFYYLSWNTTATKATIFTKYSFLQTYISITLTHCIMWSRFT